MSAQVIRRVVVRGRVQGVGFRAFVEDEARQRRITGWVRNRRDGSVEAVFAGSLDEIDRITAAVRRGPPGARVDAAEVSQAGDEDLRQRVAGEVFSVLRTI
jgi:acylphosphatase